MSERDIFIAALQKQDPAERQAYLDEACARQPELHQQVEHLLRLHEGAGSFLEELATGSAATGPFQDAAERASSPEAPGALIGPYKLLEQIGEGGMGTVWMAQQTEPVRRLVAVKLIKAGMDSRQVIARFEAERQALALMDHANIARVLEAGTTKSEPGGVSAGRPYFVMDLVKGVPITRYCDQHHLTPRQRLELFIPVCQAVQHAHQKGIIHRDLKPSNVLVALYDGKPVPKVIDFGVAKAAGQPLTEKTLVTSFGAIVGTLEYMSPEQAEINQLDIDTRSDIYSLGVLLYELLAGSPPFSRKELEKAGMLEMLRVIREQEPSKPSTKLSTAEGLPTLAANRGTEPAKLTKLVRGELDWIVMKALEKDRNRRYETANGFAMDVQRYLADEHVLACPPSAWYRFRKFARRNKVALSTAAVLAAVLVLGIIGTTWQAIRATEAEGIAEDERAVAQKQRDHADQAREAERKLRKEAEQQKRRAEISEAKARNVVGEYLGQVMDNQLLQVPGLQPLRRDLLVSGLTFYERYLKERGEDAALQAELADAQFRVAKIHSEIGQRPQAQKAFHRAQLLYEALARGAPDKLVYQDGLARCHFFGSGDYTKAAEIWKKLVAVEPENARFQQWLANAYNSLAVDKNKPPEPAEALQIHQKALAIREGLVRNHPDNVDYRSDLGATLNNIGVLLSQKNQQEALVMYRRAAEQEEFAFQRAPYVFLYGRFLATNYSNIASMHWQLGQRDEALQWQRKCVGVWKRLSLDNPAIPLLQSGSSAAYSRLSSYQDQLGQKREAAQSARLAREVIKRLPQETASDFASLAQVRARCAVLIGEGKAELTPEEKTERQDEADLAMKALQQAIARGGKYLDWIKKQEDFQLLRDRPDFKDLVARLEEAVEADKIAQAAAKAKGAQKLAAEQRALAIRQKVAAANRANIQAQVDLATNLHAIGVLQMELRQTAEAAGSLAEALAIREALLKVDPKKTAFQANLASTQIALGDLDWKAERYPEGVRRWQKGLALFDAALREEPQNTSLLRQAAYYQRTIAGRYGELGLWEKVVLHVEQSLDRNPTSAASIPDGYGHVLTALGKHDAHHRLTRLLAEKLPTHVLLAALMNPQPVLDQAKLFQLVEKLNTTDRYESFIAGMAYYRAGQFEKALKLMQPKTYTRSEFLMLPHYAYWHAMAYQRLDRKEEAAKSLRQGEQAYQALSERCLAEGVKVATRSFWWDLAVHQALRREAWELLTGKPPPPDPWKHLIPARAYMQLGEIEKADAEFAAAVVAAPNDADTWQARGKVFALLGRHQRAQADFAKAIKLKPADPQLWMARGRFYAERGKHAKADADFAKAARLTPDELNRFIQAGWWVVGPYPESLKLPCPPEIYPDPSKAVAFAPFPVLPVGSPVAGLSLLAGLAVPPLDWKPCPADHNGTVQRVHPVREGNVAGATVYGLTYVYSPDKRPATLLVGGDLMRVWLNGRLVYESTRPMFWEPDMDRVPVTLNPGRNTLLVRPSRANDSGYYFRVRLADTPLDRGLELLGLGLWKEAASSFARGFQRQWPDGYYHWSYYAATLLAAGDEDGYRRHCAEMLERLGPNADVRFVSDISRDCCLGSQPVADPARLVQLAEKALAGEPKAQHRHAYLALAQYRAGQFKEVVARLTEYPDEGFAACVLAMAYHRLGQTQKARDLLTKADRWSQRVIETACAQSSLKINPPDWNVWTHILRREAHKLINGKPAPEDTWLVVHRSLVYARLGQPEKAEAAFAAALNARPKDPHLWIARGRFYAERGQHKKADADFAKAATLTHDELNRFLEAGWWVAGPYPADLKTACPPEKGPDPSRPVAAADGATAFSWKRTPAGNYQMLDFRAAYANPQPSSAYVLNYLFANEERTAMLLVGGNRDVRVWLNGRLVHEAAPAQTWPVDLHRVPVTLRAGRNTLLAKASSAPDGHWVIVRIADGLLDRGNALAELGLWDQAAPLFRKGFVGEREPDVWAWGRHAALLLAAGDRAAYREHCARMREVFRIWSWSGVPYHVARVCALSPDGIKDAGRLVELAQKGQEPSEPERYRIGVLGWAYYRAGKFEDCVQRLTEIKDLFNPTNQLFIAMAHHRLGHTAEARKWLTQVEESYAQATREALKAPTFSPFLWGWRWNECAEFMILLREAKALIEGTAPKEDPNQAALQAKARQFLKRLDKKTAAFDWALAMQQDQPRLWLARGRRYAELKRWKEADADLAKAVDLKPDDPQVCAEAGRTCAEHGRPDRAAKWFARSLGLSAEEALCKELERWPQALLKTAELRPDDLGLLAARGHVHALCRRWQKAAADYARLAAAQPEDGLSASHAAGLHLLAGDKAAYERYCRSGVERFAKGADGATASGLALVCGWAPKPPVELEQLVAWGQKAVAANPERPWHYCALGLACYRAGRFQEAVKHLKAANAGDWEWRGVSWPVLAMAHHRLGNTAEAQQWLRKTRQWLDAATPKKDGAPAVGFPFLEDWLTANLLLREAEKLLKEPSPKGK